MLYIRGQRLNAELSVNRDKLLVWQIVIPI